MTRWHGTMRQTGLVALARPTAPGGTAQLARDLAVASGPAEGYPEKRLPDASLEARSGRGQGHGEAPEIAAEIGVDLFPDRGGEGRAADQAGGSRPGPAAQADRERRGPSEGRGDRPNGGVHGDRESPDRRGKRGIIGGAVVLCHGFGWLSCQRWAVARLRKGEKTAIRRRVASMSGLPPRRNSDCRPLATPVSPSGTQSANPRERISR